MAYEDLKITVQGFVWDANIIGADYDKISFFNTYLAPVNYHAWTTKLDIMPYLIKGSLKPLSFEVEEFITNEVNEKFFSASNVSFSLADFENLNVQRGSEWVTTIRDFLSLTPTDTYDGDTTYIKYLVKFYYQDEFVWQGIINPSLIEQNTNDYNINITCIGLEKEFADYYSNYTLEEFANYLNSVEYLWQHVNYTVPSLNGGTYTPLQMDLQTMLQQLFTSVNMAGFYANVNLEGIKPKSGNKVGKWRIFKNKHIYYKPEEETTFKTRMIKNSFDDAVVKGDSCWSWFSKLCNSMGWVYYFKYFKSGTTEEMELVLKNRYDMTSTDSSNIIEVNNSNLLKGISRFKKEHKIKYPYILLKDGGIDALTTIGYRGNRGFLFSNNSLIPLSTNFFQDLFWGMVPPLTYQTCWYGNEWMRQVEYSNDDKHYLFRTYKGNSTLNQTEWTTTDYLINKNNILELNVGDCDYWRYCFTDQANYDPSTALSNSADIDYSGNYGNMLAYWYYGDDTTGFSLLYDYNHYVRGVAMDRNYFQDNIKALLNGKSNVATEISIIGVNMNINKTVHFSSTDDIDYSGKSFTIQSMDIDFVNDITSYSLISN